MRTVSRHGRTLSVVVALQEPVEPDVHRPAVGLGLPAKRSNGESQEGIGFSR